MQDQRCTRRTWAGIVLAAVWVSLAQGVQAEQEIVPAALPQPDVSAAVNQEAQVRARINGSRWALELTPIGGEENAKVHQDHVTFDAKHVSSERLSKAGYGPSNYTLTIGEDGALVWETMQTKEGEGVAFWRGEFQDTAMRGVLSKHPLEGPTEDYSLSGQQVKGSGANTSSSSGSSTEPAEKPSKKKSKKKKKDQAS